jgi:hypothetical protein
MQVLPAFIGMAGFVVLTIYPFQQRVPQWSNDLAASMQKAELMNVQTRASILQSKAQELFALTTADAAALASYATALFSDPTQLPLNNSYPLFSGQKAFPPAAPAGTYTFCIDALYTKLWSVLQTTVCVGTALHCCSRDCCSCHMMCCYKLILRRTAKDV